MEYKLIETINSEYKIVTSSNAQGLVDKITLLMNNGWDIIGGHHVIIVHSQNRFSGTTHKDTIHETEYSQTMIKNN